MIGEPRAHLVVFDLLHEAAVRGVPDREVDLAEIGLVGAMGLVQPML